jgi:prolipoprotein diacylglyceryltransferase
MDRVPRVAGTYALGFFLAYAPVRILMDFYRPLSTDVRYGFFTPAQYFVLFFFVVSAGWLYRRHQSEDPPVWAPRNPPKA